VNRIRDLGRSGRLGLLLFLAWWTLAAVFSVIAENGTTDGDGYWWLIIPYLALYLVIGALIGRWWAVGLPLLHVLWAAPVEVLDLSDAEMPPLVGVVFDVALGGPVLAVGVLTRHLARRWSRSSPSGAAGSN
jgi:hypothetical protein